MYKGQGQTNNGKLFSHNISNGLNNQINLTLKEINRIIDLGFNMKFVLMHIMKLINNCNHTSFKYQQQMAKSINILKQNIAYMFGESMQGEATSPIKGLNSPEKTTQTKDLKPSKQQMIQKIVSELYNARQDAIKIEQLYPNTSFTIMSQNSNSQKEIKDYFMQIQEEGLQANKYQRQNESFKKYIEKLEAQNKIQKKLIEDSTITTLQKQQKIQSLKTAISKLQQYIIKQSQIQGQTSSKPDSTQTYLKNKVSPDPLLIKSQVLEKQNLQLKKEIQNLKQNLAKSQTWNTKKQKQQKQKQFIAMSKEYQIIKFQINQLIRSNSRLQTLQDSDLQNSFTEQIVQSQNLKDQLDQLAVKYKKLLQDYSKMKQQYDKVVTMQPPIIKKSSNFSIPSPQYLNKQDLRQKKSVKNSNTKSRKNSSKSRLDVQSEDQQQIFRNMQAMSQMGPLGVSSFDAVINPSQMASKIKGFQYNNSIINKVNCSKFIQGFQAKLSLVLQYVCLIQLYFAKGFLSCLREQLMMQDSIIVKPIKPTDLNPSYFSQIMQQNSFSGINSSKISCVSSPNKMIINSQFSITEKGNNNKNFNQLSQSAASLPNPIMSDPNKDKTRQKIQKLQFDMKQLSSIIPNQYLNPHELREDPQFISRVQKLRQNGVAVVISNLVKQNQVFKKCLNQMIRNQQNFTKQNNEIYFDDHGQIRRRSSNKLKDQPNQTVKNKDKDKQNCTIF